MIDHISDDLLFARTRLKRRPWTRNFVGTQFGGSIYAMTDPIYMVMMLANLGNGYIVWDKSASIRFRKPGRMGLVAEFRLETAELDAIRERLLREPKMDWERDVLVKDETGEVIAEVHKVLHIRRKDRA